MESPVASCLSKQLLTSNENILDWMTHQRQISFLPRVERTFGLRILSVILRSSFLRSRANLALSYPCDRHHYLPQWEIVALEHVVQYHYPPDDLIPQLVDNYFRVTNSYMPLLHRPSFERALADHRHHTDIGFGSVVMLVCAIGARWSDDPRCILEGTSKHSAGWKWFDQVQIHRRSFMGPPRLYDLQIYVVCQSICHKASTCLTCFQLSSIFLQGSSSPQSAWTMIGIGIRLAQDVGAHRRKVYNAPLSVESELWKRAFWYGVFVTATYPPFLPIALKGAGCA